MRINQATRSESDPTGQATNRRKANRDNNQRLNDAARRILRIWTDVDSKKTTRKKIVNENLDFYLYELTDLELEQLEREIQAILFEALETEQLNPPFDWYYSQYVETAARSGAIQENEWVTVLLAALVTFTATTSLALLSSPRYQAFLIENINSNYSLLKNLSGTTSRQIFDVITRGIDAGLSKTAIRRQILERFEVSKSSSKRIVDTEVNKIYNNSRINAAEINRDLGAPIALQHLSALLPTTRPHHAIRHGRAYTPEQQKRWWDTGTNRINCHCSVRSIEVNKDGTVTDKESQKKVIERGEKFFKG